MYPIDDRFIDQKRIFKELGEEIITSAWYQSYDIGMALTAAYSRMVRQELVNPTP